MIISKKFERDKYTANYLVEEEHEGMRLDQFLQIYLESFSRQAVKKKISNKEIKINGRPGVHRPSTKLHHKEVVTLTTNKTEHEDEWWRGEKIDLELDPEIVFEDDDLLVISKPTFMSTHPTGKHLFNCATVYFESIYNKTVHSIHRLDRETSGILMLGKNPDFTRVMTDHFENNRVHKCYFFIAVIDEENYKGPEFIADERMGPTENGLKRMFIHAFPKDSEQGKHAKTKFKVLHMEKGYAVGLAFPITGRQHQIRVHAKAHGLPLLGDKLYLGNFKMFQRFKDVIASKEDHDHMEIPRHALHAIGLQIPFKNEIKTFVSHIPKDLKSWIDNNLSLNINELEGQIKEIVPIELSQEQ